MASSRSNVPKNQSVPRNIMGKADTFEDEIDLIDYFMVLWKRKYFIVLFTVLPALILYSISIFSPRDYKLTYLYDIGLTEKNYKTLLDKFYSDENLGKLTAKLKENELSGYRQEMIGSNVKLEVSPSYFGDNAAKATDVDNLQKIQEVTGTLLAMTVMGRPERGMQKLASIVRDDFEKVIPIYTVREELSSTIAEFKDKMAHIEKGRFILGLELKEKKAILTKLKNLEATDSNGIPDGIILQFNNAGQNREYLPLAYQIQANISNIIDLEERIGTDREKYNYYENLLSLNEKLFVQLKDKRSSYYTIQEFRSSLTDIINNYEDKELIDYLNAYTKRIDNMISENTPVIEMPSVYPVPKSAAKKSMVVFAVMLMITTFVAFLLEAIQKRQVPTS